MKKITINIILVFCLYIPTKSQNTQDDIIKRMINDINYLASDELEGRKTGSKSEKLAAEYIINRFKEKNLLPKGEDGYIQTFEASINIHPHSNKKKKITGLNVIGLMNNNQDETIIIGAHFDHLGYGGNNSLHTEKEIHNGADDNASGVSILINLIDQLKYNKLYNYLFIGFSGEEEGLLGSSYYAKNPTIDLEKVRFMINFDMVGRLNQKKELAINGVGTSSKWDKLLESSNEFKFTLVKSEPGIGPSDHTSFYLQNIPVLHFFTGQHEDYHKPSDDIEKINFIGMFNIMEYVDNIIEKSIKIKTFDFQETVNDTSITPKFTVTLGIMPDYLFNEEGIRVDGVSKNKTAYKYGVKKGDIIMQMGDIQTLDMMKYMKALSIFNKQDTTTIIIKRGEEKIKLPIVFQ